FDLYNSFEPIKLVVLALIVFRKLQLFDIIGPKGCNFGPQNEAKTRSIVTGRTGKVVRGFRACSGGFHQHEEFTGSAGRFVPVGDI
ncbi:hypothetical protein ACUNV4_30365, partial [Granulosicoccus sp. 3-233]|uniref:hypothetical protein n=1 Tax=Granulosicoccus sp. 3-233 TaxID=3417969 RepID=UPI003D32D6D3